MLGRDSLIGGLRKLRFVLRESEKPICSALYGISDSVAIWLHSVSVASLLHAWMFTAIYLSGKTPEIVHRSFVGSCCTVELHRFSTGMLALGSSVAQENWGLYGWFQHSAEQFLKLASVFTRFSADLSNPDIQFWPKSKSSHWSKEDRKWHEKKKIIPFNYLQHIEIRGQNKCMQTYDGSKQM